MHASVTEPVLPSDAEPWFGREVCLDQRAIFIVGNRHCGSQLSLEFRFVDPSEAGQRASPRLVRVCAIEIVQIRARTSLRTSIGVIQGSRAIGSNSPDPRQQPIGAHTILRPTASGSVPMKRSRIRRLGHRFFVVGGALGSGQTQPFPRAVVRLNRLSSVPFLVRIAAHCYKP